MEAELFALQTAPYMILVERCRAGHLHVLGGFVSDVPAAETEVEYSVNRMTGEVFRWQSNIAFSLN